MSKTPQSQAFGPTIIRLRDVMDHTTRYAFCGVARLAADAKVSPASVSRLVNGKMNPTFGMVSRITTALEQTLGYRIDPRDIFAESGRFLTPHVCELMGCTGCLPENATDEFGDIKPAFKNIKPGRWVSSRFPSGYQSRKKGGIK